MAKTNEKSWYMSKTKWAGILGGVGMILPALVTWLTDGTLSISEIWTGIVIILGVCGIRDLPVLNK